MRGLKIHFAAVVLLGLLTQGWFFSPNALICFALI